MSDIQLAGFSKLTLLDYPGKMAAILFLQGCDMKCPFCHNSELIPRAVGRPDFKSVMASAREGLSLPERAVRDGKSFRARPEPSLPDDLDEALDYLDARKGMLDGVVVTGGEPSVQDIIPLLARLRSMGYLIKIDTNGLRPDAIRTWLDAGLADYIAMDVKNSPDRYAATCGLKSVDLGKIHESIELIESRAPDYEFRTTVAVPLHDERSIESLCRDLIPGARRYFLQRFMPRDTVIDKTLRTPSDGDMQKFLSAAEQYVVSAAIR